jgi:hypothetical protein
MRKDKSASKPNKLEFVFSVIGNKNRRDQPSLSCFTQEGHEIWLNGIGDHILIA